MVDNKKEKRKEDTSKYGEFVCSAYHWLPIEKQKEQAEKLSNITSTDKTPKWLFSNIFKTYI